MVELLLALPVLLLLGLGVAQYTLIYQAKHALDYALIQAARQGSVDHASLAAVRRGLAQGLVPYLHGATDWAGLVAAEASAADHLSEGIEQGWISLRQRSPSQESFDDWAVPALDPVGDAIAGLIEIPNDNLDNRRTRTQPASGVAGSLLGEPIGSASGQSLADANMLRLEMVYGVRLVVPVIGSLIIRTLSAWNGCAPVGPDGYGNTRHPDGEQRLGLVSLKAIQPHDAQASWMCDFYLARDGEGRAAGRIPLRLSATLRMMSTARQSDWTRPREDPASGLASLGVGRFEGPPAASAEGVFRGDGRTDGAPGRDATARGPQPSVTPLSSQAGLDNGFLRIGSDRPYPLPLVHPAVCPG